MEHSEKEGLLDGYSKFGPVAIVGIYCVTGVKIVNFHSSPLMQILMLQMGKLREVKCPAQSLTASKW